ncbi:P-loop containing nucleoside triphosphate hydrolase protein [Aureobasidium pullulans]|nr:P-loop containing nucleoside triphosphate hydrolase protein [Aureobasidium pullulans]
MQMEQVCTKLAQRVADNYANLSNQKSGRDSPVEERPQHKHRYMVAIAGGPGSGKSTIAGGISERIRKDHKLSCSVVSVEGFMLPKADLDKMDDPEKAHARRGAEWTFDGKGMVDFIRRCRHQTEMEKQIRAPDFDEEAMDPHPHGEIVDVETQVLIFEGIYLLSDTEPWKEIQELADDKWFVHVEPGLSRKRVAERRQNKGIEKDLDKCYQQYDESDGKNNAFITEHMGKVDLIIENNDEKGLHEPEK